MNSRARGNVRVDTPGDLVDNERWVMDVMSAKAISRLALSLVILAALASALAHSSVPGPALASGPPAPGVLSQSRPADLAAILERCAAYCDKLSRSVLDFVCAERVEETIALVSVARPAVSGSSSRAFYFSRPWGSVDKRTRSKYL